MRNLQRKHLMYVAALLLGALLGLGVHLALGYGLTQPGAPFNLGRQAHHISLQYNPDGVQMTCTHAELGWTATMHGDGAPFQARCDQDGPVLYVWDATS